MAHPIVAVVGRPNVGKSTLVNRIAQTSQAIVHESAGVTRDRSYHDAEWNGRTFTLIDTGGIELASQDIFQESIANQAYLACEQADAIIFLVDGRAGVTPEDENVARTLKRSKKPLFLVVNKLDNPADESALWDFYSFGLGDPYPVSSIHGHGTGDLLDDVVAALPEPEEEEVIEDDAINVAIIGRPNAGKSSLTNRMTKKERSIVSDVAGTTRDALDTLVEHEGTRYRIVDTAGLRKKSVINDDIEYYGFVRAMRAIDRADVTLLVVDSTLGITDQDQRVANLAIERGCGLVILLNKWDLLTTPEAREEVMLSLERNFGFVSYAPLIRISALTGRSIHRIWDAIDIAAQNRAQRLTTSRINKLVQEIKEFGHTVTKGTRQLKINYATQTGVCPPEITFFANSPDMVTDSFRRYLENRLRETFDFTGTPLKIRFKNKQRHDDL